MIFSVILESKIKKTIILFSGVILIVAFWYAEKTKLISQYGVIFYEMGLRCNDECGQNKQLQYFKKSVRYSSKASDAQHSSRLSDAHCRLALIYEEMGDRARSLESLMRAVGIDQGSALAYYRIGLHYFKEGSYEYALRYFLQSFKIRSCHVDEIHYYLARIYDKKKEYALAIPHYHSAVLTNKEYAAEIYPRLAEIHHFQNDEEAFFRKINGLRATNKKGLADLLEQCFKEVQDSEASDALSDKLSN